MNLLPNLLLEGEAQPQGLCFERRHVPAGPELSYRPNRTLVPESDRGPTPETLELQPLFQRHPSRWRSRSGAPSIAKAAIHT